jgi:large subunit ribosomal protein L10
VHQGRHREPRADKVAVVEEVRARIEGSAATVLTEYRGLSVGDLEKLRRSLREAGGTYKIFKNSLVRRAVAEIEITGLDELLLGPTALTFADEDVAKVAKALRDYSRENDKLVLKGAVLGGDVLDASQVSALADLPSRDELLARLAGGFQAPTQKMATLLHNTMAKFAWAVQALMNEKDEDEAA